MQVILTLETSDAMDSDLLRHIGRFYGPRDIVPVGRMEAPKDPYENPAKLTPKRGGEKATETAPVVEPTATMTGPAVTNPAPEPAKEPAKVEVPTEKQLTELIAKVQKSIGLQKFRDALSALGVKRVSELPQDKLVAFYAERMADVAKFERGDGSLI